MAKGSSYPVKQALVWQGGLSSSYSVSKGKIAAQLSHASVGALLNYAKKLSDCKYSLDVTEAVGKWIDFDFAKVALKVNSEDELVDLKVRAEAKGLNTKLIVDNGTTTFGKPTITCLAIGPDYSEKVDEVTSGLKLL